MSQDRQEKILHSTGWILARIVLIQILNVILVGYLARNNAKELFGNVAIISIIVTALSNLITQTFPNYIIYSKNKTLALSASIQTSVVFAIILVLLTYFLVTLQLIELSYDIWFKILILKLPLDAYTSCLDASYTRDMRFRFIEKRDIAIQVITICLALFLALNGRAVEAMLLPLLLVSFLRAVVMMSMKHTHVSKTLDLMECIRAVKYTKGLVGTSIANTLISEGDSFFVSKWFGPQSLGIYNISWRTANILNRNMGSLVNRLIFPYMRKNSDDLLTKLLALWNLLSALFTPIYVFMFFYAEYVIELLYGSQWDEAVLPFRILLLYSFRMMLTSPINSALKVLGKTNLIMNVTFLVIPVYLGSVYFGKSFGLVGIACGVMLSRNLGGVILMNKITRLLQIEFKALFLMVTRPLLIAVLCCMFSRYILFHLMHYTPSLVFLNIFICFTLFALMYTFSLSMSMSKGMFGLINEVKKSLK